LHPAREGVHINFGKTSGKKINLKIFSKKLARIKKLLTFAPAKRENGGIKKE